MTIALLSLLAFCAWTLLLVAVGVGGTRISLVLAGKARANAFCADVPHGTERYQRLMRAHLNCVENLPVFAAIVLTAAVTGLSSAIFGTLAIVVVVTRVGQSLVHIASGRSRAVLGRFAFFGVQLGCMAAMGVITCLHLLARG